MADTSQPDAVWAKLQQLLGGGRVRVKTGVRGTASPAAPDGDAAAGAPAAMDPEEFDRGLTDVIARQQVAVGGKVHVVNVQQIRDRLGKRWDHARERIHTIIESTLDQRLARQDFYARHQDLNYVIVFGELDADEAAFKCSLLAKEILGKVLGSDAAVDADIDIRGAAARIDGGVDLHQVDGAGALARLLDRAAAEPEAGSGKASQQDAQVRDLAALLESAEEELLRLAAPSCAEPDAVARRDGLARLVEVLRRTEEEFARRMPRPSPPRDGSGNATAAARLKRHDAVTSRLRTLLASADAALAQAGTAAGEVAESEPSGVSFHYKPIWNVHQKAMGTYLCEMTIDYADGTSAGDAALPPDPDPALLGRINRLVLRRTLVDMAEAVKVRMISAICVPVNYGTLAATGPCREFMALCSTIPDEYRSYLVWEIVGVPEGIWENSLFSMVSTIRPFGRAVFMRRAIDQIDFSIPAAVGIHSIGLDLGAVTDTEAHTVLRLEKFAERAHNLGLNCHIYGLTTSSMCLSAIGAGFDYVSGPAISESTDTPWGILPFDAEKLFLNRLADSFTPPA